MPTRFFCSQTCTTATHRQTQACTYTFLNRRTKCKTNKRAVAVFIRRQRWRTTERGAKNYTETSVGKNTKNVRAEFMTKWVTVLTAHKIWMKWCKSGIYNDTIRRNNKSEFLFFFACSIVVGMRSEIARARMKHEGIIIQYRDPFDLCITVAVLLLLFICLCMCFVYFRLWGDQFEKIRALIDPQKVTKDDLSPGK